MGHAVCYYDALDEDWVVHSWFELLEDAEEFVADKNKEYGNEYFSISSEDE